MAGTYSRRRSAGWSWSISRMGRARVILGQRERCRLRADVGPFDDRRLTALFGMTVARMERTSHAGLTLHWDPRHLALGLTSSRSNSSSSTLGSRFDAGGTLSSLLRTMALLDQVDARVKNGAYARRIGTPEATSVSPPAPRSIPTATGALGCLARSSNGCSERCVMGALEATCSRARPMMPGVVLASLTARTSSKRQPRYRGSSLSRPSADWVVGWIKISAICGPFAQCLCQTTAADACVTDRR
jgi:hypothetical protein